MYVKAQYKNISHYEVLQMINGVLTCNEFKDKDTAGFAQDIKTNWAKMSGNVDPIDGSLIKTQIMEITVEPQAKAASLAYGIAGWFYLGSMPNVDINEIPIDCYKSIDPMYVLQYENYLVGCTATEVTTPSPITGEPDIVTIIYKEGTLPAKTFIEYVAQYIYNKDLDTCYSKYIGVTVNKVNNAVVVYTARGNTKQSADGLTCNLIGTVQVADGMAAGAKATTNFMGVVIKPAGPPKPITKADALKSDYVFAYVANTGNETMIDGVLHISTTMNYLFLFSENSMEGADSITNGGSLVTNFVPRDTWTNQYGWIAATSFADTYTAFCKLSTSASLIGSYGAHGPLSLSFTEGDQMIQIADRAYTVSNDYGVGSSINVPDRFVYDTNKRKGFVAAPLYVTVSDSANTAQVLGGNISASDDMINGSLNCGEAIYTLPAGPNTGLSHGAIINIGKYQYKIFNSALCIVKKGVATPQPYLYAINMR